MLAKFFKYVMLVEAEVILLAAKKVQEVSEEFVRTNSDDDYEQGLNDLFDNVAGISRKVKDISPNIEKVANSVNKIRNNILDFPKKVNM